MWENHRDQSSETGWISHDFTAKNQIDLGDVMGDFWWENRMGYFMGGWDITARVFELLKVLGAHCRICRCLSYPWCHGSLVKLLKPIYGLTHLDEKWFRVARRAVFKKLDMFHIPKGQLLWYRLETTVLTSFAVYFWFARGWSDHRWWFRTMHTAWSWRNPVA